MRFVRDFSRRDQDYDLYQAVLHTRPVETLQIDFGRQFLSEGFSAEMADGLKTTLFPTGPVRVTAYSAIPRTVERGDFNIDDGLLTGMSLGSDALPRTHMSLHGAWRKFSLKKMKLEKYDEIRLGANLSHDLALPASPTLYGLAEYEGSTKTFETGTAGILVQPSRRVSLNLEGNYFDVNRRAARRTILSLFTKGKPLAGRAAATVTLVNDWLDFEASATRQRIEVQIGQQRTGWLTQVSLPLSIEPIGMHLIPSYYFTDSFGGRVHGGRLTIYEAFSEHIYAEAGGDVSVYTKITTDNDNAVGTFLWTGFKGIKGISVAAGGEYNRNNLLQKDMRAMIRMDYHYE